MNQQQQVNQRVIVAGTLPPPICGTTVSLQSLVSELDKIPGVEPVVVETGNIRGQGLRTPWRFFRLLMRLVSTTRSADVVTIHLSPLAIPLLGPFALAIARVFRKPLVLRLFGGQDFRDFPGIGGWIQRWVSRNCDLYLAQTSRLVSSAHQAGIRNAKWYPTSRPAPEVRSKHPSSHVCRRFVYVGWVKATKGVPLIIQAAGRVADDIKVDVFGPFDGMGEQDFQGCQNVRYRGVIAAGKTIEKLREYDALILPTHWEGEGYPGVILEAYLAGIPVITTRWRDIPEIVDDSCGILIEPHSVTELRKAIQMLHDNPREYQRLCAGAERKGQMFRGSLWAEKLVEFCSELVRVP